VRVLHVIQELGYGGAERVVVSLVEGARRAGHEAAVVSAGGPLEDGLDAPAYRLPVLARRPWLLPAAARAVRRAAREFRPDVVHFHNPGMAAVGALATLRGRRPPGLVTVHGVPEEDYASAARVLRLAGLPVVACGPDVEQALGGVAATIENAVPPAPAPADRTALAAELGIAADTPLVVTVGRLTEQKNQALAVRALAAVPDAVLLILGEGPLRDSIAAAARDAGVADRVVLGGVRPDAREVVGAADAFVLSSTWEGLPLAVLEALAAGTPVVATAVRGVRDLVQDDESALLVPPGAADALAAALRRVLDDRELAARLADGGRAVAAAHGDEPMVAAYLDLYARFAAR
jgi:glycosyltransferase involved in cell wall biosynthesis